MSGRSDASYRENVNRIMESFLLSGLKTKEDDSAELMESIRSIIARTKNERREAVRKYRDSHVLEAFLTDLIPVYNLILYEAYAPYWLLHCKPDKESDDVVDFTYYNDLIDMYWAAPWQEWKRKNR